MICNYLSSFLFTSNNKNLSRQHAPVYQHFSFAGQPNKKRGRSAVFRSSKHWKVISSINCHLGVALISLITETGYSACGQSSGISCGKFFKDKKAPGQVTNNQQREQSCSNPL